MHLQFVGLQMPSCLVLHIQHAAYPIYDRRLHMALIVLPALPATAVRLACHAEEAVTHVIACRPYQARQCFRRSACGLLHEQHQVCSAVQRPVSKKWLD